MGLGPVVARPDPPHQHRRVSGDDLSTLLPSRGYLVDMLPGIGLFGVGLLVMVAPLTRVERLER